MKKSDKKKDKREKSYNYFQALSILADYTGQAADLLNVTMNQYSIDTIEEQMIKMHEIEHAADIAKGVRGAREIDDKMADARRKLDWEAQWECAMDPETAKRIWNERKPEHDDTCSMCGKFCAVRSMNKALAGEHIDIL